MPVTDQEEYQLKNGQTVSIQLSDGVWEVACWNKDDTAHWYREYPAHQKDLAKAEFERWREY